jgi:hypothetical protein
VLPVPRVGRGGFGDILEDHEDGTVSGREGELGLNELVVFLYFIFDELKRGVGGLDEWRVTKCAVRGREKEVETKAAIMMGIIYMVGTLLSTKILITNLSFSSRTTINLSASLYGARCRRSGPLIGWRRK